MNLKALYNEAYNFLLSQLNISREIIEKHLKPENKKST